MSIKIKEMTKEIEGKFLPMIYWQYQAAYNENPLNVKLRATDEAVDDGVWRSSYTSGTIFYLGSSPANHPTRVYSGSTTGVLVIDYVNRDNCALCPPMYFIFDSQCKDVEIRHEKRTEIVWVENDGGIEFTKNGHYETKSKDAPDAIPLTIVNIDGLDFRLINKNNFNNPDPIMLLIPDILDTRSLTLDPHNRSFYDLDLSSEEAKPFLEQYEKWGRYHIRDDLIKKYVVPVIMTRDQKIILNPTKEQLKLIEKLKREKGNINSL